MKLLRLLFSKYLIVTALFAAWILFFDQNDWYSQKEREQELQDVKDNITTLNLQIQKMEGDYRSLMRDPKVLEQYAREHYRMKKDNEDLYVIEKQ